jgi:hypothetical protein
MVNQFSLRKQSTAAKLSPESSGTFSDLQGENAETRSTFKTFSSPLASATTTVTNGDPSPQEISSSKKRSLADDDAVDVEDILGQSKSSFDVCRKSHIRKNAFLFIR